MPVVKQTFEEWMKAVDQAVQSSIGVSVHDLPDYAFRDAYDDGVAPNRVAKRVIKAAKDY